MTPRRQLPSSSLNVWLARLAVAIVFLANVTCAAAFLAAPDNYLGAFELSGLPGRVVVQALGILFLMWNVPYLPVLWRPTHTTLYLVILAQQLIGLAGETWLWLPLAAGHPALRDTGLRFIAVDGLGLALLAGGFGLARASGRPPHNP